MKTKNSMYPHQASVFLRLECDLVSLLTHADVVLNELGLVDDLLNDEANDYRDYRDDEEERCIATFVLDQRFG